MRVYGIVSERMTETIELFVERAAQIADALRGNASSAEAPPRGMYSRGAARAGLVRQAPSVNR